jgi:hypothetical protein
VFLSVEVRPDAPPADRRAVEGADDTVRYSLVHLDPRVRVVKIDATHLIASDTGLPEDGAEDVSGADAVPLPQAQEDPNPGRWSRGHDLGPSVAPSRSPLGRLARCGPGPAQLVRDSGRHFGGLTLLEEGLEEE